MHDPLQINLEKQLGLLLSSLGVPKHISEEQRAILQSPYNGRTILTVLSQLLRIPSLISLVAQLFRPLIVDLCARWLDMYDNDESTFMALAFLIGWHPEIYPVLVLFCNRASLRCGPLAAFASNSNPPIPASSLHPLLVAYYRILWSAPHLVDDCNWPLEHLAKLFVEGTSHPDPCVRFLAIRCFALQTRMGELHCNKLLKQSLDEICKQDIPLIYGYLVTGEQDILDGWVFPFKERQRLECFFRGENDPSGYFSGEKRLKLQSADLSPQVSCIGSVLLVRSEQVSRRSPSSIIFSDSIREAVTRMALCFAERVPVLLTSPPSSGKRTLLNYIASSLVPEPESQIITLHLADTSLDPRSILGSYVSSPTRPGQFEWQDGLLIHAMTEGKWLLLKDIDKASSEMQGILLPLIESFVPPKALSYKVSIEIPSRGKVIASPSFAIVATRSVHRRQTANYSPPTFLGARKFVEIALKTPDNEEQIEILKSKFSGLPRELLSLLRDLWRDINDHLAYVHRLQLTFRHLERFCRRIGGLFIESIPATTSKVASLNTYFPSAAIREEVLMEARDTFLGDCGTGRLTDPILSDVLKCLSQYMGFPEENVRFVLLNRDVPCDLEKDGNGQTTALRIGRSRLPCLSLNSEYAPKNLRPFVLHRPARDLLSRIATCVRYNEPLLLVGETGTGKTSLVTFMAETLNQLLVTINMSMQTETSDLLGGFRPIDARSAGNELLNQFMILFEGTFSRKKNTRFEQSIREAVYQQKWKRAVALCRQAVSMAIEKFSVGERESVQDNIEERRRKRPKVSHVSSLRDWQTFENRLNAFEHHHITHRSRFAFAFVEGPIAKAIRNGYWLLLDEINLTSPETLESLAGLLESSDSSITLVEKGTLELLPRHKNFRLFACMNPATDVGKRDLPPAFRSRFTELYADPPDAHRETLVNIIEGYIGAYSLSDKSSVLDVAEFFIAVKQLSEERRLVDGSNHRPHYSIRTLVRALMFVVDFATSLGLRRALWEGCLMSFAMSLDAPSLDLVLGTAQMHLLRPIKNLQSFLSQTSGQPVHDNHESIELIGTFWLNFGPMPRQAVGYFILTPSVQVKIANLARAIAYHRSPILIEGPTSSGKTSSIEYIARRLGHRFIRINNHEHTDIQEYLGSYQSDSQTGKLVFRDGLLVRALRRGDWIVLDELNLAPSEVLEALNRLLDDNRELLIPDTQEIVKPHHHFMLFATQNPHGLYAGRKVLSKAFRNRFLEFTFDDVPQDELETIVCERCSIAPSFARRIVNVFRELQKRRQITRVFESKQSFATLRDVFRWANRQAGDVQSLAEDGYMLLAERTRRDDDRLAVKEVIESVLNVRINEEKLYGMENLFSQYTLDSLGFCIPLDLGIVWTRNTRRAFILLSRALRHNEPVLLVGNPGSGKTTLAEIYARCVSKRLHTVNCHQNTEAGDILGSYRPVRNRANREAHFRDDLCSISSDLRDHSNDVEQLLAMLSVKAKMGEIDFPSERLLELKARLGVIQSLFEWQNGPLINAMQNGEALLLDELSLVDDSVLERLNSVLEPERRLTLAENTSILEENVQISATQGFQVIATMNPGGDFGKKELSPALRNRFTEIWVPCIEDSSDIEAILSSLWRRNEFLRFTTPILCFKDWLSERLLDKQSLSLRDLLGWVEFINLVGDSNPNLKAEAIFHHAAHMIYVDGLPTRSHALHMDLLSIRSLQTECDAKLQELIPCGAFKEDSSSVPVSVEESKIHAGPFAIFRSISSHPPYSFDLTTDTARINLMRVMRACQLKRPILLEGSPGVGKTSLVAALSNIVGCRFTRINLSDQTDLMDLFGHDLPREGGQPGEFVWKEADFLTSLQEGGWVLLDEMNLAPQAVLEGLNAIFDHRGSVYLPDLDRSFRCHPEFRVFAAQNPVNQGGGRKGLPKSFTDRFTMVYVEAMGPRDISGILRTQCPQLSPEIGASMVAYNLKLHEEINMRRKFAKLGSPWEFNLRDILRWAYLSLDRNGFESQDNVLEHAATIYLRRFRSLTDVHVAEQLISESSSTRPTVTPWMSINELYVQVGSSAAIRQNLDRSIEQPFRLIESQRPILESIIHCIKQNWLVILTGQSMSGKSGSIRTLANICGTELTSIHLNGIIETSDLLGGFEQVDKRLVLRDAFRRLTKFIQMLAREFRDDKQHLRNLSLLAKLSDNRTDDELEPSIKALLEELCVSYGNHLTLQSIINDLDGAMDGHFQWKDGLLVQAMRTGSWVILENANLCPPSVLDRLNSLCEPGGILTLSERGRVNGVVESIVPHSNFRLFMALNPQYGELSRAMRNRGVELSLDSCFTPSVKVEKQLAVRSRALSLTRNLSEDAVLIGHDSMVETVSLQMSAWTKFSQVEQQDVECLLGWLFRITPLSFLPQISRLWAQVSNFTDFQTVSKLSSLEGLSVSSSLFPQLLYHRSSLAAERSINSKWLDWQPLYIASNPNLMSSEDDRLVHMQEASSYVLHLAVFNHEILSRFQDLRCMEEERSEEHPLSGYLLSSERYTDHLNHTRLLLTELFGVAHSEMQLFLRTHVSYFTAPSSSESKWATLWIASLYLRSLVEMLNMEPVEYLSLINVSSHLATVISEEPTLPRISRRLKYLLKHISPTCGKSMAAIWLSYFPHQSAETRGQNAQIVQLPEAEETLRNSENLVEQSLYDNSPPTDITKVDVLGIIMSLRYLITGEVFDEMSFPWLKEAKSCKVISLPRAHLNTHRLLWSLPPGSNGFTYSFQVNGWTGSVVAASTAESFSAYKVVGIILMFEDEFETKYSDMSRVTLSDLLDYESALREESYGLLTEFWSGTMNSSELLSKLLVATREQARCLHFKNDDAESYLLMKLQNSFANDVSNIPVKIFSIGHSSASSEWVELGLSYLRLYVPDVPLDPICALMREKACWELVEKHLERQIRMLDHWELSNRGSSTLKVSSSVHYLLEKARKAVQPTLVPKVDISLRRNRLRQIFSEIWQFLSQVMSTEKLQDLLSSLDHNKENARIRESVIQETILSFIKRLANTYPEYRDLLAPLELACHLIQFGLRLSAQYSVPYSNSAESIISILVQSPAIASVKAVEQLPLQLPDAVDLASELSSQIPLLKLAAHAVDLEHGFMEEKIEDMLDVYEILYRQWLLGRFKEEEEARSKNSWYRTTIASTKDSPAEEDWEDDIKRMFSAHDEECEVVLPSAAMPMSSNLLKLHMQWTMNNSLGTKNDGGSVRLYNELRGNILFSSFKCISQLPLTASLDGSSLLMRLSILDRRLTALNTPLSGMYDFYADPNIQEARDAVVVVFQLMQRLRELVSQWPEQMILHDLLQYCSSFLQLKAESPLAQILGRLESLLHRTLDWETYASRDTSLAIYQERLTNQVIRWRRLELAGWADLLATQLRKASTEVFEYFFPLYEVLIHRTLKIATKMNQEETQITEHLSSVLSFSDSFLSTSPRGQFENRLDLLMSFLIIIEHHPNYNGGVNCVRRTGLLLRSLHHCYTGYKEVISRSIHDYRSSIEKEMKEVIKLASWRGINVVALKQSVQKNHHSLLKCIRRMRSFLREPVTPYLVPSSLDDILCVSFATQTPITVGVSSSTLRPPLTTLDRFLKITREELAPVLMYQAPTNGVENLSTEIIETLERFSKDTSEGKANQGLLLTQKRRAWTDLLKELRRLGVSGAVNATVRANVNERLWVLEQPPLPPTFGLAAHRCENYYFRIVKDMPEFEASLRNHHADISTRELEKAIGYHENLFHLSVLLRSGLSRTFSSWSKLNNAYNRMCQVLRTPRAHHVVTQATENATALYSLIGRLKLALDDIAELLAKLQRIRSIEIGHDEQLSSSLDKLRHEVYSSFRDMHDLMQSVRSTTFELLSKDEHEIVQKAELLYDKARSWAEEWSQKDKFLSTLLDPLLLWLPHTPCHSSKIQAIPEAVHSNTSSPLVNSLLVIIQQMKSLSSDYQRSYRDSMLEDDQITGLHQFILRTYQILRLEMLYSEFVTMVGKLEQDTDDPIALNLTTCMPFLEAFIVLVQGIMNHHTRWLGSVLKLTHIFGCVLRNLACRGFCRPMAQENMVTSDSHDKQQYGTGFGDGHGEQEVAEAIRDKSQLEGLQNQKGDSSNEEEFEDISKNSVELELDNEGNLHNPDPNGNLEQSEDEAEDRIEDIDPRDPSAVDEKLWGERGDASKQESEEDRTENSTKQDEHQSNETSKRSDNASTSKASEEGCSTEKEQEQCSVGDMGELEEPPAEAAIEGAQQENPIPESEVLDIPENLSLANEMDLDVPEGDFQESGSDIAEDVNNTRDGSPEEMEIEDTSLFEPQLEGTTPEAEANGSSADLGGERTSDGSDRGDVHPADSDKIPTNREEEHSSQEIAFSGEKTTGQSVTGQPETTPEDGLRSSEKKVGFGEGSREAEETAATEGIDQIPSSSIDRELVPASQTLELSETSREILKSFTDDVLEMGSANVAENDVMQYSREEESKHALGPSDSNEAARLQQLPEIELAPQGYNQSNDRNQMDEEFNSISNATLNPNDFSSAIHSELPKVESIVSAKPRIPSMYGVSLEDISEEDCVQMLENYFTTGKGINMHDAESIWRLLEVQTHDLSFVLCERLRLILEPTQATRLKGDFRTGKRLNMKKIIPYIASEYTKDKIWLRRTKPSRREYQVLISLDDSKSMGESQSISLAFHTLALVTMALNRLEAGDVAVARFGESTDIVHNFDDGAFNSHSGAKVISSFGFDQRATDVLRLIETTLRFLKEARHNRAASASAMDLWQLQVIISDGICQDHERLRPLLRLAGEQRVMTVFIVLDSLHTNVPNAEENSILSMSQVGYKTVAGRQELEVRRYMDSFPFDYYVILRDIRSLPEILSSTLEQFFEVLAEQ